MSDEREQGGLRVFEARLAIVRHLRECWPYSETLTPSSLSPTPSAPAFVQAAQELQDHGLIMYEVLLVGAGPEPILREAMLTRKGQFWEPNLEGGSSRLALRGGHLGACCEP